MEALRTTMRFTFVFLLGSLASLLLVYALTEVPSQTAPSDFITERDIEIFDDHVIIYVSDASLSTYAPTGSMRPLLDSGANGIRVRPATSDEILVGDLITFESGETLIIHRVIEKGIDAEGIYFITKGDNNTRSDGKIRFEAIRYKTIALLY